MDTIHEKANRTRPRYLFLPIEIRSRELYSKIFLSGNALGHELVPVIGEARKILGYAINHGAAGDILLHKGGLEMRSALALRKKCVHFCILDEELSPSGAARGFAAKRIAPHVAPLVDLYLATDEVYAAEVSKEHPILRERIHVVGFPRLELLSSEIMTNLLNHSVPASSGHYILVCTGFGCTTRWQVFSAFLVSTNYSLRTILQRMRKPSRRALKQIFGDLGILFQSARSYLNGLRNARKFAADIGFFCQELGTDKIILRPHPNEDQSIWLNVARRIDNLIVNSEIPLEVQLSTASVLVHFGSTSAFQAKEYGLQSISLSKIYNPRSFNISDEISDSPQSLAAAVKVIKLRMGKGLSGNEFCAQANGTAGRILAAIHTLQPVIEVHGPKPDESVVPIPSSRIPKLTTAARILEILDIGQTRSHEKTILYHHISDGLAAVFGHGCNISITERSGCFILEKSKQM